MDSEFNDLTTNNLATSFDASPNNIATSDELSAPAVFQGTLTSYAKSRRIAQGITTAIAILSVGVGGVSFLTSQFVDTPPTISANTIDISSTEDCLDYAFAIDNPKGYAAAFEVLIEEKTIYTLEVTEGKTYSGSVTDLGYDKSGRYVLHYQAGDYRGVLWEGTFVTAKKENK